MSAGSARDGADRAGPVGRVREPPRNGVEAGEPRHDYFLTGAGLEWSGSWRCVFFAMCFVHCLPVCFY